MKRFMIIPFIVLFAFILSINSSAQDKKMEMKKKVETTETKIMDIKHEVENKVVNIKPVNTVCPVSGEEVDPKITAVYQDKTYSFCCKSCLKKFNKDPEKYVSKLSEDGKSLKKNKQQ